MKVYIWIIALTTIACSRRCEIEGDDFAENYGSWNQFLIDENLIDDISFPSLDTLRVRVRLYAPGDNAHLMFQKFTDHRFDSPLLIGGLIDCLRAKGDSIVADNILNLQQENRVVVPKHIVDQVFAVQSYSILWDSLSVRREK